MYLFYLVYALKQLLGVGAGIISNGKLLHGMLHPEAPKWDMRLADIGYRYICLAHI